MHGAAGLAGVKRVPTFEVLIVEHAWSPRVPYQTPPSFASSVPWSPGALAVTLTAGQQYSPSTTFPGFASLSSTLYMFSTKLTGPRRHG